VPDSPLHPDRPVPVDRLQVDPSDVRAAVPVPDRVQVEPSDVRAVVAALPAGSVDLILLDVDNGPDFLVYDDQAAVYESPFLSACRDALTPAGLVAVWSAETSTALTSALESVFGSSRELALPVTLQSRETTYHLFLAPR
jgi:spermidine synthase